MALKNNEDKAAPVPSESIVEGAQNTTSSLRAVVGIIVIVIGVYATLSSIMYLFNWQEDLSLLRGLHKDHPDSASFEYGNAFGGLGARVGDLLIGRSFGLAGIVVPIYLVIFGLNIFRGSKRIILNRDTLTMFIGLILTSLTFGALFGSSWDLFGSGLGGAFGLEVAKLLAQYIDLGLILLLIGAWVAFGIFINSNFINVINNAGSTAKSSTDKLMSMLKRKKDNRQEVENDALVNVAETPQGESQQNSSAEQIGEVEDEINPFIELTINDIRSGVSSNTIDVEKVQAEDDKPISDDDNPFMEVISSMPNQESTPIPFEVIQPQAKQLSEEDAAHQQATMGGGNPSDLEQEDEQSGTVVFVEINNAKTLDESEIDSSLYDPTKDINNYVKPTPALLEDYQAGVKVDDNEIFENKTQIEETLNHFGIPIQQIKATVGPTITLYEIVQANGVKISKIQGLENDIAQSLKALGIRIIAPIPGKGTIGIEVPNRHKQIVSMRSAILSPEFQGVKAQLPVVIGRTIQNENYVFDLAKMPHLLVAGATGQGKSVGLNAIITSLLYSKHPSELKFVMIDPKMVEFSPYKSLENHYLAKMESEDEAIITDPKKAVYTLNAICEEMESRLRLLSQAGVRNIVEYNDKFRKRVLRPDKGHFFMPYIVVVIDEFADLIMTAKEVEMPVMRIAQKARAVGIHLIVATQRPDVKVITGGIKANFPARIAFKVTQMIDSRTIIDQPGANQLIGRGDMLFSKDGDLTRIQCALVETDEVSRIVDHICNQPSYSEAYRLPDYAPEGGNGDMMGSEGAPAIKYDSLFAEIARAAVTGGGISTSAIQRNFEVGFNRAGRIMTQLERSGIVGRQEGSKPRDILFYDLPSLEAKLQELGLF